jgi:hypothetical protein
VLAEHLGDRGLPRHRELERHLQRLAGRQREGAGDPLALERHRRVVLAVLRLHLDLGDQRQFDVFDGHLMIAALDVDLTLQGQPGPRVRIGEHRVHRGTAHAERLP